MDRKVCFEVVALGLVAFVLVLQLLGLPEWIDAYLKRRRPGRKLEEELAELRKRERPAIPP